MIESPNMTYNFELNEELNPIDIKNHVLDILKERFVGGSKTHIEFYDDRWNFACPFCGDSSADSSKKRGNIYLNDYHFHCFNCGEHKTLLYFLKSFDRDFRTGSVLSFVEKRKIESGDTGFSNNSSERVSDILGQDIIEYAIPKTTFFERMGLTEIQDNKRAMAYLLGREQKRFENFGWDAKRNILYIFNLDNNKEKILGYQIRRFSENGPKYLTYEMSAMYKELGISYDQELMKRYDPLSTIFGCLSVDLSSPITIFEGPLDSFLMPNSLALCSLQKKPPFLTKHTRFLFDYDKSGIEKSLQLLKEGFNVFMWSKFFSENIGFEHFLDKSKVDYSDIVIYAKKINKKIDFNQYFTNNFLNAIWIGKTNKKKRF
jgi:transcription elongation factor Elf1